MNIIFKTYLSFLEFSIFLIKFIVKFENFLDKIKLFDIAKRLIIII